MSIVVANIARLPSIRREPGAEIVHVGNAHSVLYNPFQPASMHPREGVSAQVDPQCAEMSLKAYKYFLWLVDQSEAGAELPELVREVWSGMTRQQRSLISLNNYWSGMHRTPTLRGALGSLIQASQQQDVYLIGYSTTVHGPGIRAYVNWKLASGLVTAA